VDKTAKTKALAGIAQVAPSPARSNSSRMAIAAPRVAAAETPSVNGLASGLLSTVCISAPASPKAAPTSTAMTA
jgi:hypothetical protein